MHSVPDSLNLLSKIGIGVLLLSQQVQAWGCGFTITSSGGIACPAGQLSDGQIRLNGSEPTATFYIQSGQIIDSAGRGCIITGPPETQVQCDQGKPPQSGFTIDENNTILYNGSPNFAACPATDTEYNIYTNPQFGQTKCFDVTLTASGCGSCPAPPPPVTQTVTATFIFSSLSTVTSTTCVSSTSPQAPPVVHSSSKCHKCTETNSAPSGASSSSVAILPSISPPSSTSGDSTLSTVTTSEDSGSSQDSSATKASQTSTAT